MWSVHACGQRLGPGRGYLMWNSLDVKGFKNSGAELILRMSKTLWVRFMFTDLHHRHSSVGFYFKRLLIICCGYSVLLYRWLESLCHLSSSPKETVTICIGCLGRECFACTILSACVDSFRLYEDTYQSDDFDLKQHFCAFYSVMSYNGQNVSHNIRYRLGITTRSLA